MHERIVEILIYVLNEVRKTNKPFGEIDLSTLQQRGYTEAEIGTAFSWLLDRLTVGEERLAQYGVSSQASFRILHPAEQHVITTEAFGYLLQLRELHLLSDGELEATIERAMLSGLEKITPGEMQSLIGALLFEEELSSERGRTVLLSSDTIH